MVLWEYVGMIILLVIIAFLLCVLATLEGKTYTSCISYGLTIIVFSLMMLILMALSIAS